MSNTNLIIPQNIQGNIGSCKTESVTVLKSRDGFWTINKRDISTNSCTGEVANYDYWEYSDMGGSMLMIMIFFGLSLLLAIIVSIIEKIGK